MLPSIPKKTFEYRNKTVPNGKIDLVPFTVGLESILLQVKDSDDPKEQIQALKQVIQECIRTKNIDVEKLPMFVLEEIFLRLREKSIGEFVNLSYRCSNKFEDKECGNKLEIQVDLREMKLVEDKNHTNKIMIEEPLGIQMKYPTADMLFDEVSAEEEIDLIVSCIDLIFDESNVYTREDATDEEFKEFWKQLTLLQKKEIFEKFWLTIPHLHYKKTFTCSKCEYKHEIEFNSMMEVFA